MASPKLKYCGLSRLEDVRAAEAAGVDYVGFVFFPKSPRNIDLTTAKVLAEATAPGATRVALVVDPTDEFLDELMARVEIDMIQLHGRESPERVAEVKARTGRPVMKAIGIASEDDVAKIADYETVADQILVDAKAPSASELPGGNGTAFDWSLIAKRAWRAPWMLAGGLTQSTVQDAIAITGASQIDVSSGIESQPGVKDSEMMLAFAKSARAPVREKI